MLAHFCGVFAPRAAGRHRMVPGAAGCADRPSAAAGRRDNPTWAALRQRSFGFAVLKCPRCAGRLRLTALIHQPDVIRRILTHLGVSAEVPRFQPSRAPPEPVWMEPA
jgi:hypothetical protein